MDKETVEAIMDLMSAAGIGPESSEVLRVPEGSTIAAELQKRGFAPEGEPCTSCGEQHVWGKGEGDDRKVVFAIADHDMPSTPQTRAIASLDERIKEMREALDIATELRASIAQPLATRPADATMNEMILALKLRNVL